MAIRAAVELDIPDDGISGTDLRDFVGKLGMSELYADDDDLVAVVRTNDDGNAVLRVTWEL